MSSHGKGKIAYAIQSIHLIPLLFFGIIILMLGTYFFEQSMYAEVETELTNVSRNISVMYDYLYPGDYSLVGEEYLQFYKGEHNLSNKFDLIDHIKEDTGFEVTIFYQDTRILTTITSENGKRIIGSGAPALVISDVLESGEAHFYKKAFIHNTSYFSYYTPLINSDGTVVGMLFVGKPTAEVDAAVQKSIIPLMIADIVLMIVVSLFTFLYTKHFVSSLLTIHSFLGEVSAGNLNTTLPGHVLSRNDELGEIAQSAINMQHSLRVLVEQDALTLLLNRRSGDRKLRQIVDSAIKQNRDFCVAIGDIDFFKKVNDTYGHECGDLILKNVAAILKKDMRGKGFVARWGGEEFLLVFEDRDLEESTTLLNDILSDVVSLDSVYGENIIKVSMTFGLCEGYTSDVTALLCRADSRLYIGKTNGRNQVVTKD